jgi:hypothetical protein
MACLSCRSVKQVELTAEMLAHFFPGLKSLDKPTVWLFPKLLVCLDCGTARFTVPETELAQLSSGAPKSERSTAQQELTTLSSECRIRELQS